MNEMPYNEIAEQSVLGAMLLDSECIDTIMESVQKDYFYNPKNKEMFETITDIFNANTPIDVITIAQQLNKRGTFDKIGGETYLVEIVNAVPTSANIKHYIDILKDVAIRRRLLKLSNKLTESVYDASKDVNDILVKAEGAIIAVDEKYESDEFITADKVFADFFATASERAMNKNILPGLSTGFEDLDNLIGGLIGGYLYVIAARPAMGKTALATNIVANATKKGDNIALFSLEMGSKLVMQRMIADESLVSNTSIKLGLSDSEEWNRIVCAGTLLGKNNLVIDDNCGISADYIRLRCRKLSNNLQKQNKKLDLIVVDYLQIMGGSAKDSRLVIEDNCRKLKILSKELDVPVILLSQLSRAVEQRADKRPTLADLRETGAIEQDADLVAMIYRDDYYNKDSEQKGISEIIIAKQRDGATGTIKLGWSAEHTRFYNIKK